MSDSRIFGSDGSRYDIVLPAPRELAISLTHLHSADYSEKSIAKSVDEVWGAIGNVPLRYLAFPNELDIYRARRHLSSDEALRAQSFYCPPAEHTPLGRTNLTCSPVLYGSLDPATPCLEMDIGANEPVWIAAFAKKPDVELNTLNFTVPCEPDNIDCHQQALNELLQDLVSGKIENWSTSHSIENLRAGIEAFSYLFVMKNYQLSARVAHYYIYNPAGRSPAIVYSSNQDYDRKNIAIHPKFAKEYFDLDRVYKCNFHKSAEALQIVEVGIPTGPSNAAIEWQAQISREEMQVIERKFTRAGLWQRVNTTPRVSPMRSYIFDSPEAMNEFLSRHFDASNPDQTQTTPQPDSSPEVS